MSRRDYSAEIVSAARSVLLEVNRLLGEYAGQIVVIGGWVPDLLLPDAADHVGSIDVDLALNHLQLDEIGYRSILEHLVSNGYRQGEHPFIFYRTFGQDAGEITVQVDFLAGELAGTGKSHRTQVVQGMRPRKARGVDIVFRSYETVTITGRLPEGGFDAASIQVASIPAFLVMKGFAMAGRLKDKDPWDIYYCIRNYPGGTAKLIEKFRTLPSNDLVKEALRNIAQKFSAPDAVGPIQVANFEEPADPLERELIRRDAFERVRNFLNGLGVS